MIDDPRRLVVLALVGVLAVALAAATVTSTAERTVVRVSGGLNASDTSEGYWSGPAGLSGGTDSDSPCLGGGLTDAGWVAALALVGATAVVHRRYDRTSAIGVLGMGAPAVVLVVAAGTACGTNDVGSALGGGAGAVVLGTPSIVDSVLAAVPGWLVVLLGAVLAAAVVVATGDRRDVRALLRRLDNPTLEPEDDEEDAAAAIGRVAGRAADRIETGVDADNEVFRAWRTMTDHLDVDRPESSTPAEFADAAVEAGLGRESVAELTELFEAVRYGGEAATDERERRAVAALRRIQRDGFGGGERP